MASVLETMRAKGALYDKVSRLDAPCFKGVPRLSLLIAAQMGGYMQRVHPETNRSKVLAYSEVTMQVHDDASLRGALPLVLQHASLAETTEAPVLCTVLSVCKAWRAALEPHCKGRFCVKVPEGFVTDLAQFVRWIENYGHLLAHINFMPLDPDTLRSNAAPEMTDELEAAFTAVAASPKGLNLRSFQANREKALAFKPSILQQLSPGRLTSLSLRLSSYSSSSGGSSSSSTAPPLSLFTNLRSLSITLLEEPLNPILAALPPLTQLTHLCLRGKFADGADLTLLPPQIITLSIPLENGEHYAGGRLQISHLTAVTKLAFDFIDTLDELPPHLTSFYCYDCSSLDPLRPLQQLQSVAFHMSYMPARALQQLPGILPKLKEIGLSYGSADAAAAAADAWPNLVPAVTSLAISNNIAGGEEEGNSGELPSSFLQQQLPLLGRSLLSLELDSHGGLRYNVAPAVLAASLTALTALTRLTLGALDLEATENEEQQQRQWGQVMESIAKLQNLQHLKVHQPNLGWIVTILSKLTSLQTLSLPGCGLKDIAVTALMLNGMPQLRVLALVPGNGGLRGSFAPVLAQQLPRLEQLWLPGKAATDETVSFLARSPTLNTIRLAGSHRISSDMMLALSGHILIDEVDFW